MLEGLVVMEFVMEIVMEELSTVFPPKVTFTNSASAPVFDPAVKTTEDVVVEFRVPKAELVRVHE